VNDAWVLSRRGPKTGLDPFQAYASLWEEEPDAAGRLVPTAAIFLTNRECPFRCVMCDLWTRTLDEPVPAGAIPGQIRRALAALPPARQVKLYNAGSFFDPDAVPPEDAEEIAGAVRGMERVIVESHPAFLAGVHGERCVRLTRLLDAQLEVAIGLETVNPRVLPRLNKRMTLGAFRRAAAFLHDHGIALRAFVLLNPPFLAASEAVDWACLSIDEAARCGAAVCSVIPTRAGNGALEALGREFEPARLRDLETVVEYGVRRGGPRVFGDLWDVERLFDCGCGPRRAARIATMNREQRVPERVECRCDGRL
jgi:radical SAM enzyme (TIGR01210 family)